MKNHIKLYEEYSQGDSQFFNTYEETKNWLDTMGVKNYTINDDLTVDVDGFVKISGKKLENIPVQFRKVTEQFYCERNKLTSLKGCPKYVGGAFYCNGNMLSDLEYSPKSVGDRGGRYGIDFSCERNQLITLKGSPKIIHGEFNCSRNNLSNLLDGPVKVGSNFNCNYNNLTSLEGCPLEIIGSLYCHYNKLTSLVFATKEPWQIVNNPCVKIYNKLGFTKEAHIESLKKLDPNPADTIQRLKKYNPALAKEISLELGLESEELNKAYKTSKDVGGDFY